MLLAIADKFYSLFGDPEQVDDEEKVGLLLVALLLCSLLGFFVFCVSPYGYVVSNLIQATLLS